MPVAPCRTLADLPVSSVRDRGSADYEQRTNQAETGLEGKDKVLANSGAIDHPSHRLSLDWVVSVLRFYTVRRQVSDADLDRSREVGVLASEGSSALALRKTSGEVRQPREAWVSFEARGAGAGPSDLVS
jgi:hypothetical protein